MIELRLSNQYQGLIFNDGVQQFICGPWYKEDDIVVAGAKAYLAAHWSWGKTSDSMNSSI